MEPGHEKSIWQGFYSRYFLLIFIYLHNNTITFIYYINLIQDTACYLYDTCNGSEKIHYTCIRHESRVGQNIMAMRYGPSAYMVCNQLAETRIADPIQPQPNWPLPNQPPAQFAPAQFAPAQFALAQLGKSPIFRIVHQHINISVMPL